MNIDNIDLSGLDSLKDLLAKAQEEVDKTKSNLSELDKLKIDQLVESFKNADVETLKAKLEELEKEKNKK